MTNFQVYKKTLSFSLLEFVIGLLALVVLAGFTVGGFFLFNNINDLGLIGLILGFILGVVALILVDVFIRNRVKAAQISMMTKGVMGEEMPEHTFKEGFAEIKGRFGRITGFYFISRAIKGIFKQVNKAITGVATVIGGQTGNTIGSAVETVVDILLGYLCDCCMGWILYRKDINMMKAGCEGTVIFFKHGKTLFRNIGRIFGMGILSFLLIGGAFTGIFCLIFFSLPTFFSSLSAEIVEFGVRNAIELPEFVSNVSLLTFVAALVLAIFLWSTVHGVFIRPFILVGVLRNYMAAGKEHMPTEADFAELDKKSPKFAKLHNSI